MARIRGPYPATATPTTLSRDPDPLRQIMTERHPQLPEAYRTPRPAL